MKTLIKTALVLALSTTLVNAASPITSITQTGVIKSTAGPRGVRTVHYTLTCPYDVGSVGTYPHVVMTDNDMFPTAELGFTLSRGDVAIYHKANGIGRTVDAGIGTYDLFVQSDAMPLHGVYTQVNSHFSFTVTCYNRVTLQPVPGLTLNQ